VIIKTQKVDPRTEGGARILIKESDRDVSSLEKSSTDTKIKRILTQISTNSFLGTNFIKFYFF
jgi:hypothetical protein